MTVQGLGRPIWLLIILHLYILKVDDYGRLKKIEQINIDNAMGIDLPKEKCITFSYGKRFGNYYGKSAFKPIRKNWLLKDAILKMWASALDKFGYTFNGSHSSGRQA